ncbi:MAG: hypothetical protein U0457_21540 [Candidatus Sericytochromatia bacterium]
MKKLLSTFITAAILFSASCTNTINNDTLLIEEDNLEAQSLPTKNTNDYMCVSLPTGGDSEIVKVFNIKTKEVTSLPIPGSVQDMAFDNNFVYVSSKAADYYSLFKIDIKAKQVSRILLFSQLGIKPADFVVDQNNVYVNGKRSGTGVFYVNDLIKNEWKAIANVSPGRITFGFDKDTYHIISFDDQYVSKTAINVKTNQVTARKAIEHKIPFGNNIFVAAPHGNYVYILHQLQDSFIPYAVNLKQGKVTQFDPIKTDGGLLYSVIVSNDGKHLLANVNRVIYHYKLDGDQLNPLPKIKLNIPESRNMAMLADNLTLYVTHDTGSEMSMIKFAPDLKTYTETPVYVGGSTNQIYIF